MKRMTTLMDIEEDEEDEMEEDDEDEYEEDDEPSRKGKKN